MIVRSLVSIDYAVGLSHDLWVKAVDDGRSMSAYRLKVETLHGTICADQMHNVSVSRINNNEEE